MGYSHEYSPNRELLWGNWKVAMTFRDLAGLRDDEEPECRCDDFHIGYSNNILAQKSYWLRMVYEGNYVKVFFSKKDLYGKLPKKIFRLDDRVSLLKKIIPFELFVIVVNKTHREHE